MLRNNTSNQKSRVSPIRWKTCRIASYTSQFSNFGAPIYPLSLPIRAKFERVNLWCFCLMPSSCLMCIWCRVYVENRWKTEIWSNFEFGTCCRLLSPSRAINLACESKTAVYSTMPNGRPIYNVVTSGRKPQIWPFHAKFHLDRFIKSPLRGEKTRFDHIFAFNILWWHYIAAKEQIKTHMHSYKRSPLQRYRNRFKLKTS